MTIHSAIIDEYWHDFLGFNRVPSRAHIRLIHTPGKPVIVICSQPLHRVGTSVQNAYEILKSHVVSSISEISKREIRYARAETVADLSTTLKTANSLSLAIASFLVRKLSEFLRREEIHNVRIQPNMPVVWLEHWPRGSSYSDTSDDYLLVREMQDGSPLWQRIDVSKIASELGYNEDALRKDSSIFNA